ncbi:putative ADP-ribose pyrophosphatase [Daldinia caldariorum]|uniref:putative ADP-ribose pyrophosphatase n=1 Tax=Daldinia caldariorum TaxID=326644 RepID=UPI0020076FF0|nr:putative ADP-ribose pyrophosphatase [Daldinia caldariorum]KAI1464587.1 putative ADP-ribose pyrophosphatase [Daldinia caldariorum]
MSKRVAKVISTELLENKDAKWINLVKITYEDEEGQVRTWEAIRRPGRPSSSPVDAVQMIAVIHHKEGPRVLLEKQFRAPAGQIVIEFPAGLVDRDETVEQAALRELKEETGYIGEVVPDRGGSRPILFSSPASSSSKSFVIHLKIDPEKEENQNPQPLFDDGEFIEAFWVPLNDLYAECRKLESQGFAIDGKVGVFAEGLEMSKIWSVS